MDKEYYYNGGYVTIFGDITDKPDYVAVREGDDYGGIMVARRADLKPKEESYTFKQAQKRADELRLVTAKAEENFERITEKVIKAACSSLSTRMKMNILFKSGLGDGGWAVTIAEELNKLVREKAPEIIENEKD